MIRPELRRAQQSCRRGRHGRDTSIATVGSPKPAKHRHGRAMRARHLDDEGALDLISGLGALDEGQAGVHSDFADPAVRQPCRLGRTLERLLICNKSFVL